jgi:4-alpha-glucanotransferase
VSSHAPGTDEWGITDGYHDVGGTWHPTTDGARDALRAAMGPPGGSDPLWFVHPGEEHPLDSPCRLLLEDGTDAGVCSRLPGELPIGYHTLVPEGGGAATRLVCAPARCPEAPPGWGVASQLYAMLSESSQGIGDLADLAELACWVASAGGIAVLLSPLHAPSPGYPQQDSPYSPASRVWRNPLHLRVAGPAPWRPELLDRDETWRVKQAALRAEFAGRRDEPAWRAWATDLADEGIEEWAAWCASVDGVGDPDFHRWLQWCFDEQLAAVRVAAPRVALIGDLAIGFDPEGADARSFAPIIAHGCNVGAPPDLFNPAGQNWGLAPFAPWRLRAAHYAPFVRTIRGALRGLQGLRMDHVMGLFRQYWIPPGGTPRDGAYVRFPYEELLSILALEATRAGAFVIGEDLGTVEDGVRETLRRFGILGTQVAWFTDDPPEEWPASSLATLSTHDLPTVAGVYSGADGDTVLLARLQALTQQTGGAAPAEVVVAAHAGLARAPAVMKLATLDDLAVAEQRPNLPGTTVERPNWRIPLPLTLEALERSPVAQRAVAALAGGDARRASAAAGDAGCASQ